MTDPLISVIIPVYNGSRHLARALESALDQTVQTIEILVVDDGSDDGGATTGIAESFIRTASSKVRLLRSSQNLGVSSALNLGLANARGRYWSWLSHDDEFVADKLERQLARLEKAGDPDAVVFGAWEQIDDLGRLIGRVEVDADLPIPLAAVFRGQVNGSTVLAPVALSRRAPFDIRYRYTQDYRHWFALARMANFLPCTEVLSRQRLHPLQTSQSRAADAEPEFDAMWMSLIEMPSAIECFFLDGGRFRFLRRMATMLAQIGCHDASRHAATLAEAQASSPDIRRIALQRAMIDSPLGEIASDFWRMLQESEAEYFGFEGRQGAFDLLPRLRLMARSGLAASASAWPAVKLTPQNLASDILSLMDQPLDGLILHRAAVAALEARLKAEPLETRRTTR